MPKIYIKNKSKALRTINLGNAQLKCTPGVAEFELTDEQKKAFDKAIERGALKAWFDKDEGDLQQVSGSDAGATSVAPTNETALSEGELKARRGR